MDPVTLVVVGVAALALIPTVGKLAIYGAIQATKKIKKNLKKNKEYKQGKRSLIKFKTLQQKIKSRN